ncbi:MAG: M67 family peptidase [Alphaproteobacteria bacterium]|nr:MAG: M67 family peptidase [Alphaproteobacteria bacterium]
MIRLTAAQHQFLIAAARAEHPHECCGLIIGHKEEQDWVIDDLAASENLSPTPAQNFEVDMRLRLRLQKELRGTGRRIIGHYHSHPDGTAKPSATDLKSAWEDDMVWIIVAVTAIEAELSASVYSDAFSEFAKIDIQVTD